MANHTLFPSVLPDSDNPFVDSCYTKQELEKKEYAELKSIAAEHESENVNGRMKKEELIDNLAGLERV